MGEAFGGWEPERTLDPPRITRVRRATAVAVLKATPVGAGWAARAALRREARLLAELRGDGVVDLLDVLDRGGRTALVLTLVPAGSLAVRPAPDPERAVRHLAATVERLHRAGVVHGALTPDHVVLTADGDPVLVGFGHARRTTTFTEDEPALATLVDSIRSGA